MKRYLPLAVLSLMLVFAVSACHDKPVTPPVNNDRPPITGSTDVIGYGLLDKVGGIWDGSIHSTTMLGNFPEWIVDFRPISASQISAKNELDTLNDIFMSYFIAYHKGAYRVVFRNGGSFNGLKRASYLEADSAYESSGYSYYRFVDMVQGTKRSYSEVIFKSDSMIMRSYTNHYNTQPTATLHMEWKAQQKDHTVYDGVKSTFQYPQKVMVKDFTHSFDSLTDAVFYQLVGDPYTEADQPYLGVSMLSYTVLPSLTLSASRKVFLVVTTQPLFSGFTFNASAMNFRSRYVILSSSTRSFNFNYMHPGAYYLYALYDADGNGTFNSGDYISTANTSFSLAAKGSTSASTQINFMIP
jgi:hypothetical protein